MAAKQVRAIQSLIALGLFAISCELADQIHAAPFTSLFQRASLFRRHQQQQHQHQPQEQPRQPEQLVPLANNYSPQQLTSAGQLGQMHPAAELLRISGMHRPAHSSVQTIGAHQMQQPPQFMNPAASFALAQHAHPQATQAGMIYQDQDDSGALFDKFEQAAPQAAAYYKSNMVRPLASLNGAQHQQQMQQPALVMGQSFEPSDNSNYFRDDSAGGGQPAAGRQAAEPTHTSEIVDKIEQHIENKIEQGLKEDEKESSASEEPEEHEEHKEEGGEGKHKEEEEKKQEGEGEEHKEAEHKQKPEAHEHHHHHHHNHEHGHEHHLQVPPEAFEVHHKKGGKSYQYFHQGHSHSHP